MHSLKWFSKKTACLLLVSIMVSSCSDDPHASGANPSESLPPASTAAESNIRDAENALDNEILALVQNEKALEEGQKDYQSICATCHGKELEGGEGFNLRDGVWAHGRTPSEIYQNISNGFLTEGMPAFESIMSSKQRKQITAFILSNKQGFEDLTYTVYRVNSDEELVVEGKEVLKSGDFEDGLINFLLGEKKNYALVFEGALHTLKEEPSQIFVNGFKPDNLFVDIDGERQPETALGGWLLKPGSQHVKITFFSKGLNKRFKRNLDLSVVDEHNELQFFALSKKSYNRLVETRVHLTADSGIVVTRKKLFELPTYSIAVGFPSNINYSFNTRQCSIDSVWRGELLNIGPNVSGRGQEGSVPLGKSLFRYPDQIALNTEGDDTCKYKKYSLDEAGNPTFHFELGGTQLSLKASPTSSGNLSFKYDVLNKAHDALSISVPKGKASNEVRFQSSKGKFVNRELVIDLKEVASFSVDTITSESN